MAVNRPLRLHLVRHGQSWWNAAGLLQGQTEGVPLTGLGRRQADAVARHLAGLPVDLLLTSDLLRALQTAEAVSAATGLPACRDRRLREQCYGTFEGRSVSGMDGSLAARGDPAHRIGGGESTQDVYQRVGAVLGDCVEVARQARWSGIVLVSHGDTIRVALAWLAALEPHRMAEAVPANGSITTVLVRGGEVVARNTVTPPILDEGRAG